MAETKLRLEVGKKYRTRNGEEAEVTAYDQVGDTRWPFWGGVSGYGELSWRPDDAHFGSQPHDFDLVEEIVEPTYRYFRWRDDTPTDKLYVIWRNTPGDRLVEGRCPNRPGDEWTETSLSVTDDLLTDPDIVECLEDGSLIATFRTTEDLTPEARTRIAKLAARIVLADGPVLTVDELAGMTVRELVEKLEDNTIHSV
jgi:hypothetical protein